MNQIDRLYDDLFREARRLHDGDGDANTVALLQRAAFALTPTTESVGRWLDDLRVRFRSAGVLRGWSFDWPERSGYAHGELSELVEAVRGKHGDVVDEAGDVLLACLMGLVPESVSLAECLAAAERKVDTIAARTCGVDGAAAKQPPAEPPAAPSVAGGALCPCGHEWRRHDPEDGMCDAPEPEPAAGRPAAACKCGVDIAFHRRLNARRAVAARELTP